MRRSDWLRRYLVLGLSGPILVLNIWILAQIFLYFEQLITIVTIAAILAFLLNYLVRLFEQIRFSRTQAIILVLLITLTLLVILGLTLVPIVIEQATQFLQGIPNWLNVSNQNLNWLDRFAKGHNLPFNLNQIIIQIESQIQTLVGLVPGFAIGTLGRLLDTILIVVLAFYMLLYGDRLWQGLINLLPTQLGIALSTSLQWNFQRFFTGQLLLGLFMVVTLTPVFLILKVNFGLLFALLIGGFELIPFIGATLGIGLVIALVMLQGFWLALQVAIAAVVLQQIKDNVILPRLLGNFIGLNPIWIFIALLAGARVAGLLGVILSIPIAGTIKGTIEAMQALKQTQIVDRTIIPPNQPQS